MGNNKRFMPIINVTFLLLCLGFSYGSRNKRTLVYSKPVAKVQAILGVGFPVDLDDEAVIIGLVAKQKYILPQNASDYTNPSTVLMRRKREAPQTITRWDIYKLLEEYAKIYGFGTKGCILRTICELADIPIDKSTGIIEEILHAIFTPSTTNEVINAHSDNEYYAAQQIGRKIKGNCDKFFPDCKASFVDMFTKFLK